MQTLLLHHSKLTDPAFADLPPSQTTARPDSQRLQDHRTEPRPKLGGVGFRPNFRCARFDKIPPLDHSRICPDCLVRLLETGIASYDLDHEAVSIRRDNP